MGKTALFAQNQPGGVFTIDDIAEHPNNIWFVDSVTGTNSVGAGRNPDAPLASIAYAFSSDLVAAGDVIYVLPGHAETVNNTDRITCDIAGVKVIGLGWGNRRPTITFSTDTTADIDIDAANIMLKNLRFVGNIAALAAPIDVNAAGFVMEDCDWYVASATKDIDITILGVATANDMIIRRCRFNYDASNEATGVAVSAASTEVIRIVGQDRTIIEDCYMAGNFATAAINAITTKSMDIKILRNAIYNDQTADVAGVIDLVAGCTGVIAHNYGFHGLHDDASALATIIDPASCAMIENYFSNVVTETGGLVGTASS